MVQLGTNITFGYQGYTFHGIGRNDDDNWVDIHEDDQKYNFNSGIGGSGISITHAHYSVGGVSTTQVESLESL